MGTHIGSKHTRVARRFFRDTYGNQWRRSQDNGRSDLELLVIMDLAGTMLHEAAHGYGVAQADGGTDELCYSSYLIENTFRWAALKRYPELEASRCVRNWLTVWHEQDCDPSGLNCTIRWNAQHDVDFLHGFGGTTYLTSPRHCP